MHFPRVLFSLKYEIYVKYIPQKRETKTRNGTKLVQKNFTKNRAVNLRKNYHALI